MMINVTVAIGRNVGDEPMTSRLWRAFQGDVQDALQACGHEPVFMAKYQGTGRWQGRTEHSVMLSASFDASVDSEALAEALGVIARRYRQDAVALTVGELRFPG